MSGARSDSGDLPIRKIAVMLADRAESLCREILPNGRRVGNEWRCGDVSGALGNSLGVHLDGERRGVWCDFATGEKGDLLDLIQAHRMCDKGEAVKWAKEWLGRGNGSVVPFPAATAQATSATLIHISPIPATAGKAPDHPELGEHAAQWAYRDASGKITALVRRYELNGGKEFRCLTWWRQDDELGLGCWKFKHPPEPRPLYGLNRLAGMPGAVVHVCEGEKSADAAQLLFPEEPCVTWIGGAGGVFKADWSPLKGRVVIIWSDNDAAGRKAAGAVAKASVNAGAEEVRTVEIPGGWPAKWDLADPIPPGSPSDILDTLQRDARLVDKAMVGDASHDQPSDDWPDPEPLLSPGAFPRDYPIDALPPTLRNAVAAYQQFGQQPMALVACSAIAAASLACQGLANVARDGHLIGPISLNFLVVAKSGERKTSVDRRMARAIRDWQDERRERMATEVNEAQAQIAAYNAEREGILAKIKKCAGDDSLKRRDELASLKKRLDELESLPPREPILPRLFYEDTTQEAFGLRLSKGWPSASIWSDEAGLVVGSHGMGDDSAMRFLTLLNRLWDGILFERDRSTTESFKIKGRRLTACLMMQDVVLTKLLAASGGAARGTGFIARFLICRPNSTMGERFYVEGNEQDAALSAFDDRLQALLDTSLPVTGDDMVLEPPTLHLSSEAKAHWVEFHDSVERSIGDLGDYAAVGDFAAKTAENAARLAAVFHVLEYGPEGEISSDMMERGARIATWHLYEGRRLMETNEEPEATLASVTLLEWLRDQGCQETTRTKIGQSGPYAVRKASIRDAAIKLLCERGYMRDEKVGNKPTLQLNPKISEIPQ